MLASRSKRICPTCVGAAAVACCREVPGEQLADMAAANLAAVEQALTEMLEAERAGLAVAS